VTTRKVREGTNLNNETDKKNSLSSRVNTNVIARVERPSSALNAKRNNVDGDEGGGDPFRRDRGPLATDVGDDACQKVQEMSERAREDVRPKHM
jgi:hypothetical protein